MFKGPRIRTVRCPQRRVRAGYAMRLGVPIFCVVVTISAALLSSPGYGQVGDDFSKNFFSENSLAGDRIKQPESEMLSTSIELTSEQRAIGLMPAAGLFSRYKAEEHAQVSPSQGPALSQTIDAIAVSSTHSFPDLMLQQETKGFAGKRSEAASRIFPRSNRTIRENHTRRERSVIGQGNSDNIAKGYVGGGLLMTPVYSGSNKYRYVPTSFIHVEVADVFRVTHDDGFELVPFQVFPIEIALGLNWREGRLADENHKGLDPYDMTITVGGELAIAVGELELFADLEKGFIGGSKGMQIESGIKTRYLRLYDEVDVGGRLSTTWADKELMDTEFGVSATEASASNFAIYNAAAGLRDVSLSLEAFYYLTENLGLRAAVDAELLVDNAMHSPIVKGDGHPLQLNSNLGLVYRF